jgi:hypothetical protein
LGEGREWWITLAGGAFGDVLRLCAASSHERPDTVGEPISTL